MAEDTSKSAKIKLSLSDLTPKQPALVSMDQSLQNVSPDKTANLRIKPSIEKSPITLPSQEPPKVNITASSSDQEDKPRINLKKPNLQDIKLKVNLDKGAGLAPIAPEVVSRNSSPMPAYMKSNVPNQNENDASSPSLRIDEDIKGKTQKIIEPEQSPRKPIIDLNSLKIDLNKDSKKIDSEEMIPPAPPIPNIDFEAHAAIPNKVISDTVKLKIKAQTEPGAKPFSSLMKDSKEAEPPKIKETVAPPLSFETNSPLPKVYSSQGKSITSAGRDEDFVIPKDVSKASFGDKPKKKSNMIILGVMVVVIILIVYFMITTLKTLSA